MPTHKSEDYKISAIKYYLENDVSMDNACDIFKCTKTSLKRWLDKYEKQNNVSRNNRQSVSYKITKEHVKYAIELLRKNEQITMDELVKQIKKKFKDFDITPQHLGTIIRDNNKTRKRTRREHFPKTRYGKAIDKNKELQQFYKVIDKYRIDRIICLDETSIQPLMTKTYSRCDLGKRCVVKSDNNFVFRKFTLLVAISYNGLVGAKLYEKGGINKERFVEFIDEYINNKYNNNLIILDNAKAHDNDLVQTKILETKNKYLYSIPYTPKTNTIEQYFSQLKHHLRNLPCCNDFNDVNENVKSALKKIKSENYKNYFKFAYKNKDIRKSSKKYSTLKRKPKTYKD